MVPARLAADSASAPARLAADSASAPARLAADSARLAADFLLLLVMVSELI